MSVSRNTTYNVIGAGIPIALSLVTVPLYLNLIGTERYGVLAIAWLLLGYFGLFDLGLGRATSYRIAARRDASAQERADTFWSALVINLIFAIIGGALFWFAAAFFFESLFKVDAAIRPEISAAVPLLAAAVPIAILTGVLFGALAGRELFFELNSVSVTSTAMFQIFPLVLAWQIGPELPVILAGAVAARVLAVMFLAFRCYVELGAGSRIRAAKDEMVALLRYGGWVTISSIISPILFMSDRFAIGSVLGASAVSTYTVPYQLAGRMQILPSALTQAMFPRLSGSKSAEQADLSAKATKASLSLLLVPYAAAIFLVEPFLLLWVGDTIGNEAGLVGRILLVAMWSNAFALIAHTRIQASGRPSLIVYVALVEIIPYITMLYFGMQLLGLYGAALACLARNVLDFVLLTWLAERFSRAEQERGTAPVSTQWGWHALFFAHLSICVLAASNWPQLGYWQWWASAMGMVSLGLIMSIVMMPEPVRVRVSGLIRRVGFS